MSKRESETGDNTNYYCSYYCLFCTARLLKTAVVKSGASPSCRLIFPCDSTLSNCACVWIPRSFYAKI